MGINENYELKKFDNEIKLIAPPDSTVVKNDNVEAARLLQAEFEKLNKKDKGENGSREIPLMGEFNLEKYNETLKKEETPTQEVQEAQETPEDKKTESKYKGENKPANTANWADLNGKELEAIDEPDENGNIPTRPIHGELKVEGEAKNGENPKKFTITDKDSGAVYTFELDETADGKVVYRCTSGPGGAYTQGNDYELRTINGKPILVQMKDSEGHGVGVGKTNGKNPPDNKKVEGEPGPNGTTIKDGEYFAADGTKLNPGYAKGKEMKFDSGVSARVWENGEKVTYRDKDGNIIKPLDFIKQNPDEYNEILKQQFKNAAGDEAADGMDIKLQKDAGGNAVGAEITYNGKKIKAALPVNIQGVMEKLGIPKKQTA